MGEIKAASAFNAFCESETDPFGFYTALERGDTQSARESIGLALNKAAELGATPEEMAQIEENMGGLIQTFIVCPVDVLREIREYFSERKRPAPRVVS